MSQAPTDLNSAITIARREEISKTRCDNVKFDDSIDMDIIKMSFSLEKRDADVLWCLLCDCLVTPYMTVQILKLKRSNE